MHDSKTAGPIRTLPDFKNPPAVETYLGVHFDPLEGWKLPHYGLFWNRIRHDYPKVEVRPPIASREGMSFEFVGMTEPQGELNIPARCWFINQDNMRLIQVQNNIFIHNWRRHAGTGEPYSHYDDLRPIFEQEWHRFTEFVRDENIGIPKANLCEVAYINHLDRGVGWQGLAELPEVFPCWSGVTSGGYLPSPQAVAIRAFYRMKEPEGVLEVSLQPALRQADAKDIFQLTLTGRCKPMSSDESSIISALDAAREWVVRGFTDFTSTKMHEIWGRTI